MNTTITPSLGEENVALARKCLALIRDIAARGTLSYDPENVGYILQELSQVLLERTGEQETHFPPVSATVLRGLGKLLEELDFVNDSSEDLTRMDVKRNHGQWN
jgi:hypothetical protein